MMKIFITLYIITFLWKLKIKKLIHFHYFIILILNKGLLKKIVPFIENKTVKSIIFFIHKIMLLNIYISLF